MNDTYTLPITIKPSLTSNIIFFVYVSVSIILALFFLYAASIPKAEINLLQAITMILAGVGFLYWFSNFRRKIIIDQTGITSITPTSTKKIQFDQLEKIGYYYNRPTRKSTPIYNQLRFYLKNAPFLIKIDISNYSKKDITYLLNVVYHYTPEVLFGENALSIKNGQFPKIPFTFLFGVKREDITFKKIDNS